MLDDKQCNGDQPTVCTGQNYVPYGGVCTYGCSAGKCNCSAPAGRLSETSNAAGEERVVDHVTNDTFYTDANSSNASWTTGYGVCTSAPGTQMRMSTLAQMQTLLSEAAPGLWCQPNDADPTAFGAGYAAETVWTSTSCGMDKYATLSLADGLVGCDFTGAQHRIWCAEDSIAGGGCVLNDKQCSANQPTICNGQSYVPNGGACNYGCAAGSCTCSAPAGRLTETSSGGAVVYTKLADNVTSLTFYTNSQAKHVPESYGAATACPQMAPYWSVPVPNMPTVAQVETLLSEGAPAMWCSDDTDPTAFGATIFDGETLWTSDSCGATSYLTVSLTDGSVTCEPQGNLHRIWCVL